MTCIVTLVASKTPLSIAHIAGIENIIETAGIKIAGKPGWLDKHKAADIPVSTKPDMDLIQSLRRFLADDAIDVFIIPSNAAPKKLLLADMDSTIVAGETLDEIAVKSGIADQIIPVTEKAMRGEINFEDALRARVALLKGINVSIIEQVLHETSLNNGAQSLTEHMGKRDATCVLVSGGFTFFTEPVAAQAGFHHNHGNVLEIKDGLLTGEVADPILGKEAKLEYLNAYCKKLKITNKNVVAIGDGANDLPMLLAAGLGIGYHPKPLLLETLENCIIHGDLSAALYAQGFGNKK